MERGTGGRRSDLEGHEGAHEEEAEDGGGDVAEGEGAGEGRCAESSRGWAGRGKAYSRS